MDPHCHSISLVVAAPAAIALAVLGDPDALGDWALGCWSAKPDADGILRGRSLFDGKDSFVRVHADPASGVVIYHVGSDATALRPRVMARVVPGEVLDLDDTQSVVTLLAWRAVGTSDLRWQQTTASHEAEIFRIRHLIERRASPPL